MSTVPSEYDSIATALPNPVPDCETCPRIAWCMTSLRQIRMRPRLATPPESNPGAPATIQRDEPRTETGFVMATLLPSASPTCAVAIAETKASFEKLKAVPEEFTPR